MGGVEGIQLALGVGVIGVTDDGDTGADCVGGATIGMTGHVITSFWMLAGFEPRGGIGVGDAGTVRGLRMAARTRWRMVLAFSGNLVASIHCNMRDVSLWCPYAGLSCWKTNSMACSPKYHWQRTRLQTDANC